MNCITIGNTKYCDAYFEEKSKEFVNRFNELIESLNKLYANKPYTNKQEDEFIKITRDFYEGILEHSMRMLIRKSFFNRYKSGFITEFDWKDVSDTLHDNVHLGTENGRCLLDLEFEGSIGIKTLFIMMSKFCSPQIYYNCNNCNIIYQFGTPERIIRKNELNIQKIIKFQDVLYNYEKHDPKYDLKFEKYLKHLIGITPIIENYVKIFLCGDNRVNTFQITAENDNNVIYDVMRQKNSYSKITRILITDRLEKLSENEQHIFQQLNWDIIIDLDPLSKKNGLEYSMLDRISPRPVVCTPADPRYIFKPLSDLYWFRFYKNEGESPNLRQIRMYTYALRNFIEGYKANGGRKIVVVSNVLEGKSIAKDISKMICDMTFSPDDAVPDFSIESDLLIYSLNNQSCFPGKGYEGFESIFKSFSITFHQLLEKLSNDYPISLYDKHKVYIDNNGNTKQLETPAYNGMEIIYADIENIQELSKDYDYVNPYGFYLAKSPISWYSISHNQHIVTDDLRQAINYLSNESGGIINNDYLLKYEPGVGGTTALRTIAFNMSKKMPSVLLEQYGKETYKDIKMISEETGSAVFVAVDENSITMDEFIDLCKTLRINHVKHIAVYALRYTSNNKNGTFRNPGVTKLSGMNQNDSRLLSERLKRIIQNNNDYSDKDKENRCQNVDNAIEAGNTTYPFIMCMYAFDNEFEGTEPYIRHFLQGDKYDLSDSQKNILLWIAIITVHTSYSLDTGLFAAGDRFFIGKANNVAEHLLRFDDIGGQKKVRFVHPILAGEVIYQLLLPNRNKRYTVADLHDALCKSICGFIDYLANLSSACSKSLIVNTLADLFIRKESFDYERETDILSRLMSELFNGNFSFAKYSGDFGVVDKTQRIWGLQSIFETLVKFFPDEPHFHAHLGKFLAYMDNRPSHCVLALEEADKAIDLSEDDYYLYNIRANCLRQMINEQIQIYNNEIHYPDISSEELNRYESEILKNAEKASLDFEISRKNENAAGYICDIKMCIKLVDFCKNYHEVGYNDIASVDSERFPIIAKYNEYFCRAIELYKEIDEIDEISERTQLRYDIQQDVKGGILKIQSGLKDAIKYWEDYILRVKDMKDKHRAIRFYINSQNNSDDFAGVQDKSILIKMIEYSEMLLNQSDRITIGDLAQWFSLKIKYSRITSGEKDMLMLEDMMNNITRWKESISNEKTSVYKYISMIHFITACILVLQGDSRSVKIAKKLTNARDLTPKYYLRKGRPILGNLYRFKENEAKENYQKIKGVLEMNNNNTYRIDVNGIKVYCSMNKQEKVHESDINQTVEFGMLFTLQDARALFNTVTLKKKGNTFLSLNIGSIVTCEVIDVVPNQYYHGEYHYYVFVSFNDYTNVYGMIKYSNDDEPPQKGEKLQLYISSDKKLFYIKSIGKKVDCWIMDKS